MDENNIKKAINDIKRKRETTSTATTKYGIKRTTLIMRIKKLKTNCDWRESIDSGNSCEEDYERPYQSKYTPKQTVNKTQENELCEYFKQCSKLQYGLTCDMARKFVFEYVCMNKLAYPPSREIESKAGIDWLRGFLKRNSSISLRKPENTSIGRITGFTKTAVGEFFNNLKTSLEKHHPAAKDIYNLDETGVTTVLDAPKVGIYYVT